MKSVKPPFTMVDLAKAFVLLYENGEAHPFSTSEVTKLSRAYIESMAVIHEFEDEEEDRRTGRKPF